MRIIYDAVVAFFAASGIYAIAWLLSGLLLRPRWPKVPVTLVIPPQDAGLTDCIRPFIWMRAWGVCDLRIIVPEESLTDSQRAEAELLMERDPGITLVKWHDTNLHGTEDC